MEISSSEGETQADCDPLLMEHTENHNDLEHIIDITRSNGVSSSSLLENHSPGADLPAHEDWPLNGAHIPSHQASSPSSRLNSRNSSFMRRNEGYSRRRRSPLNSGVWISIEFYVTMSQIIASVVVLYIARDEKPQAPLFLWVVGYASGCVATLPILFWRFLNRNQGTEQDSSRLTQQPSEMNPPLEPTSYTAITVDQSAEEVNHHPMGAVRDNHPVGALGTRINGLVDHLKMALDCFFAVWFVVGNVWIFGGHSSSADAPILYRLCIVFLTFSCIGYAMPFILCATICCCLPCIISILRFREDLSQTRGASSESINALPTYYFKLKDSGNDQDEELSSGAGGILAEGSEKERYISGEDAVCCICLAKYADNDELRELPCSHFFHKECVDKWLEINASCPLCKYEITENDSGSTAVSESTQESR